MLSSRLFNIASVLLGERKTPRDVAEVDGLLKLPSVTDTRNSPSNWKWELHYKTSKLLVYTYVYFHEFFSFFLIYL